MGRKAPWKEVPDTNLVPGDLYDFAVKELSETMSKGSEDAKPKLMYLAQLKIVDPKEYRGLMLFDRFVIGTEDDPEAEDPETWKASIGARRMKQLVKALAVSLGEDMDDTCEAVEGQKATAMVSLDPARKDQRTGRQYQESNSITAYYRLGERPTATGAAKPAAPAAPSPGKKATSGAAGGNAKAAAPVTTEVKPTKVGKVDVTTCPICGATDVPRTGFIAHVNEHSVGQEAEE